MQGEPGHAGEPLHINMSFRADGRPRRSLRARVADEETVFDTDGGEGRVRISMQTELRGWYRIGRIRLYSEFPFGLFQVWSWLNPDFAALVYPRLEVGAPPLPHADDAAAEVATKRSGDEFAMLRDYHPSDPRRSIAWKASARHDTLLVKEFEQRRGQDLALDWDATAVLSHEARISRLAAWVNAAEAAQLRYILRLPDNTVGPGLGPDHRHACLRALALLPG
jgi:uncharacterized protein (DUF58 family)